MVQLATLYGALGNIRYNFELGQYARFSHCNEDRLYYHAPVWFSRKSNRVATVRQPLINVRSEHLLLVVPEDWADVSKTRPILVFEIHGPTILDSEAN